MIITEKISGKCQLILIPGEKRVIEVGSSFQPLEVFVRAEGRRRGYCLGQGNGRITLRVPDHLSPDENWSGVIMADGKPFCEFDVKILSRELAQLAGYIEDRIG